MKVLLDDIQETMTELRSDLEKNILKGNKTAGIRARGNARKLIKLLKTYRDKSLAKDNESENN